MLVLASVVYASSADTAPTTRPADEAHTAIEKLLTEAIRRYDKVLERDPTVAEAWQRRGIAHFRLGHVERAVADFDKFLELEPESKPHHWQRGIALYYAGRFDDAAKQFALHQTVNPDDVENSAWHFLCVARAGVAKGETPEKAVAAARAGLIPTRSDERVPLMQVHALYAGKAKPEDVLAAAKAGDPKPDELADRLFYAHLYLGLYFEALGQNDEARKHIDLAADTYPAENYMGDVARVHASRLRAATTRPALKK